MKIGRKIENSPLSGFVFYSVLSFLSGLAIYPFFPGLYFLPPLLFLIFFDRRFFLLVAFFLFGLFHHHLMTFDQFVLPLYEGEEVALRGRVVEEDRDVVSVDRFQGENLSEKVLVHPEGELHYGQKIKVVGRVLTPDDRFVDYMAKDRISVNLAEPEIEVIEEPRGPLGFLYSSRRRLISRIKRGLPRPQSAVLKAVLLGDRSGISDRLQDKFSGLGIAHLLAVSGTHIVVMAGISVSLFSFLKVKRKRFFSLLFLSLFILMVGAPPSAIRAGIMGSLFIIAGKFDREVNSTRSLLYVGTAMLVFNPRLLWNDIGFQLSFSATAGIILFSGKFIDFLTPVDIPFSFFDRFRNCISELIFRLPVFVVRTLSVTLSAQVFVLPLAFFHFGNIPLFAPISNLLAAPLFPVVMIVGLTSLFASLFLSPVISFLPADILISLLLFLVEILYRICFLC